MNTVTHTPGPWRVADSGDRGRIKGPDGRRICNTSLDAKDSDVWAANARLIAAAPDLKDSLDPDTLEAIADEIDCFEHSARAAGLRSLAKRQRAALAKCTE